MCCLLDAREPEQILVAVGSVSLRWELLEQPFPSVGYHRDGRGSSDRQSSASSRNWFTFHCYQLHLQQLQLCLQRVTVQRSPGLQKVTAVLGML